MATRTDTNQVFDQEGNVLSEETVEIVSYPSEAESAANVARLAVPDLAPTLSPEDAESLTGLYTDWEEGLEVKMGDFHRFGGVLIQALVDHTTAAGDDNRTKTSLLWHVYI